jgi:hypothetical protein
MNLPYDFFGCALRLEMLLSLLFALDTEADGAGLGAVG